MILLICLFPYVQLVTDVTHNVGSWQLAVGSWQLAVGNWQLAGASKQFTP